MSKNPVSPKVTAAALAAAVTTIVFVVLGIFGVFDEVDPGALAALEGAVVTVLTFLLAYEVADENREQGKGVPPRRRGRKEVSRPS
jgi:O-antigen/teichoic acid export membrane protein